MVFFAEQNGISVGATKHSCTKSVNCLNAYLANFSYIDFVQSHPWIVLLLVGVVSVAMSFFGIYFRLDAINLQPQIVIKLLLTFSEALFS